ncbi:LamB/YcsF family protein [Paenirhodobacter sp.]|uniref:LamB/YcsF family protein n=1 Tax=Paenirhodobacter sp. TaxID=1965326 RepID=UPI003B3C1518
MRTIDLNCDMGESFGAWRVGDDAAMLDLVSSANIACGFHAGDPPGMLKTLRMARERGVAVGAHPSFADLYGFGRRRISGERPEDLEAQLIYQIVALRGMAEVAGHRMTHVKMHGALANMAAEDPDLAALCARSVRAVDPGLILVAMPYSEAQVAAERAGLGVACEIYADRTYTDTGTLTPRSQPGAVIHDARQSLKQVLDMVIGGHIPTTGGKRLPVEAATLCVHGDTPGAVEMARGLRTALAAEGVGIAPFCRA